jgi:hypothetical protein
MYRTVFDTVHCRARERCVPNVFALGWAGLPKLLRPPPYSYGIIVLYHLYWAATVREKRLRIMQRDYI